MCLSDVNECEDPGVCGTAQCENKEGSYDCLCDIGYVYDNETKSCVGKCVYTHNSAHTNTQFHENWASASAGLDAAVLWGRERNAKTFGDIRFK